MSDALRMSQPRIVCVLGAHRSGTSLVARLLNLLGVDLGPEGLLIPPSEDNAKGYWEHQSITDLNDEILSRLGGSWHEPPTFASGWESAPALADLRQRARDLIHRDFAAAPLWGWKDPRTCLTLPFWQRLLPPMEYVICLRNPVDVAHSLHHRDGFSFEKGVNLWIAHVQSALDHTAGAPRLFLIYEDMMERWPEELTRLARFVGRPGLAEQAEIHTAVKAFVDDVLHHHRTVLIDTIDESTLAFPSKALYLVLRLYVSLSQDTRGLQRDEDRVLQEAIDRFGMHASTSQAETQSLRTQAPELERQLQVLQALVAEQHQLRQLQVLQALVAEREQAVQALSTQVAEQQRQTQQLQAAKMALEAEVGRLRQHLEMYPNSLSWKLTAPLRWIHARLRTLDEGPSGLWRRGELALQTLREVWYRTAYTVQYSFNLLPPTLVEHSGSHDLKDTIRWIPSVQIGHQVKNAYLTYPPSRVTYRLMVPPRAVFRAFVALLPEVWGRNPSGVEFTVTVSPHGSGRSLTWKRWSHPTRLPHHRRWLEFEVPLDGFANREVEFTLSTSVPPGVSADFASAVWGDPVIAARKRWRELVTLLRQVIRFYGVVGVVRMVVRKVRSFSPTDSSHATTTNPYQLWLAQHDLTAERIRKLREEVRTLVYQPKISIVMPVYNTEETWLRKAIESVRNQIYPNWELCICDDGSPAGHVSRVIAEYRQEDERIHVLTSPKIRNISAASNGALSLATGEFVGFLDHDDELTPDALYEVVKLLNEQPDLDLIYTDEDKMTDDGRRVEPFFKPDWSPDLLLSMNYITHFAVVRRTLVQEIGGFTEGLEGSQDYDLFLRISEKTQRVGHVAKPLYSWREIPGSAACDPYAKFYAHLAGRKALQRRFERRGIRGQVVDGLVTPFRYRVRYEIADQPLVSIIIPIRDKVQLLKRCLESIREKTTYRHFEIIIVDNQSEEPETLAYLARLPHTVVPMPGPFNYSQLNNVAAAHARGDFLLFLNNDIEVIAGEWLEALLEHAQRPHVGAVGAKLLYPNRTIQHAGVVLGHGGVAGHAFWYLPEDTAAYFDFSEVVRNCSAVTGACMMMRKSVFAEVGGFDEKIRVAFNDIDLCLRVREKGYVIIYTPYAVLYHLESATRKSLHPVADEEYFRRRWGRVIDAGDPYYSPHLSLERFDFSLRILDGKK